MPIIGNYEIGSTIEGTIHEFVVICVLVNQIPLKMDTYFFYIGRA